MVMTPAMSVVHIGPVQYGSIHTFAAAGDTLAPHAHDAATLHTSTIVVGRFRVISDRCGGEYGVGAHFEWREGEMHGFEALEPGSVIVQMLTKGPTTCS